MAYAASVLRVTFRAVVALLVGTAMFGAILVVPVAHAQTFTVLHTFTGATDGAVPGGAGLAIDRGGNLYGGTDFGGLSGCFGGSCGMLYKLSHKGTGWISNTLYEFHGADGSTPDAPLAFGPDGAVARLHGGADGGNPYGQIVLDANGNLYGATETGGMKSGFCGSYGCGVVWEITP